MNILIFVWLILFCLISDNNKAINLAKLKLKKVVFQNMTEQPVKLEITLDEKCTHCADEALIIQHITIPSKQISVMKKEKSELHAVSLLQSENYLAFQAGNKQHFPIIKITKIKQSDHLNHLDFFDACAFDPDFKSKFKNPQSFDSRIKFVFPKTMNPRQWVYFLDGMYKKNNLAKRLKCLKNATQERIPFIMHRIWLGSDLPLLYQQWLKIFKKIHPGWRTILWTEENVGAQFPEGLFNQERFDEGKRLKSYGLMTNIIRLELLNRYGGLYMDTDVICFESFTVLHKLYDFYTALEMFRYTCFCCNAVMAAKTGHSIIQQAIFNIHTLSFTKEVFSDDVVWQTMFFSIYGHGPGAITRAIIEKANQPENIDIVFPSIYFNAMTINAVTNLSSDLNRAGQDAHEKSYHQAALCSHEFHMAWWMNLIKNE